MSTVLPSSRSIRLIRHNALVVRGRVLKTRTHRTTLAAALGDIRREPGCNPFAAQAELLAGKVVKLVMPIRGQAGGKPIREAYIVSLFRSVAGAVSRTPTVHHIDFFQSYARAA